MRVLQGAEHPCRERVCLTDRNEFAPSPPSGVPSGPNEPSVLTTGQPQVMVSVGTMKSIGFHSVAEQRPVEKERFVPLHRPVDAEERGPSTEAIGVGQCV